MQAEIIPFERMIYRTLERCDEAIKICDYEGAQIILENAMSLYMKLKKDDPKITGCIEDLSCDLDFFRDLEEDMKTW